MTIKFPKDLFCDVRIEHIFRTVVMYTQKSLDECRIREYSAAFIRVFDGKQWYYSSTTDLNAIQKEVDGLALLATPNAQINDNAVVKNMGTAKDEIILFKDNCVNKISLEKKAELIGSYQPIVDANSYIKHSMLYYADDYRVKEYYNSRGASQKHDYQLCGFLISMQYVDGDKNLSDSYLTSKVTFDELLGQEQLVKDRIAKAQEFLLNSQPVEGGTYTVVMSPETTGIFTHECFGHKSEADMMLGDKAALAEWTLGKRMGSDKLNIVDCGLDIGNGYVKYDDEGNHARKNYIIKDGILTGRLHSATSAAELNESVTGNCRAVNFEFEPIVRMTNTYIDKGDLTKEQLFEGVKKGIFIESVVSGTGMTTFTIVPSLAYYIRDGKIAEPVRISVVSGNVMQALSDIDGISNEIRIMHSVMGGCGKMGQGPLPVADGGPYIRVKNMNVR